MCQITSELHLMPGAIGDGFRGCTGGMSISHEPAQEDCWWVGGVSEADRPSDEHWWKKYTCNFTVSVGLTLASSISTLSLKVTLGLTLCGTTKCVVCCTCWMRSRARGVAWVKTSMWMLWMGSSSIKHPMSNHLKTAKRLKNSSIHSYFSIYGNTKLIKYVAGKSNELLDNHQSVLELLILTNTTSL